MLPAKRSRGASGNGTVDTLGLVLIVVVHVASIQDRDGAQLVLEQIPGRFTRLARIWADSAYAGQLIQWVSTLCQCVLEIVKRSDNQQGFAVHPHRWIVERTFGGLNRYRRLAKEYERMPQSSEAMIHLALIRWLLARVARKRQSDQHRQHHLLRQAEHVGYFLAA
jgi:putative transposase